MKRDTREKSSLDWKRLFISRVSLFIFGCLLYVTALAECVMEEKTKYYKGSLKNYTECLAFFDRLPKEIEICTLPADLFGMMGHFT